MLLIEKDLAGEYGKDRFCHQFILGPSFVDRLTGWQRIEIGDALRLTLYPDVTAEQVCAGQKALTIIGYMLDPLDPDASNETIARALLEDFSSAEHLFEATSRYGGRWIIIARDGERRLLFHDAMGLRQVVYTSPAGPEGVWAASQPGLLAWHLGLRMSEDATAFINSYEVRSRPEYRWPGTATPFSSVKRLFPNHCLDLETGEHRRYWPHKALEQLSLDEGLERISRLLTGLMNAANTRFELVLGMTAGFDSRIVLAASRGIRGDISGTTVRQGHMPDDNQDLVVAPRLLQKLGISHSTVKALPWMSGTFSKTFKENVFFAHDHYGPDAEAILEHFSREKVVVTGSGSEIGREPFRKMIDASKPAFTAADLARLQWMDGNEFALKHLGQWLDGTAPLYNVHLLDLFSWEQSHGNWLAATQLEFDIAWQDILTPFNCRDVLTSLLSVDGKHRCAPDHELFPALVGKMWPQLLEEPINPDKPAKPPRPSIPVRLLKKLLRQLE